MGAAAVFEAEFELSADGQRRLGAEDQVLLPRASGVAAVAQGVAEEAELDGGFGRLGVVFEDGGLEVLANAAVGQAIGRVQDGLRVVVPAGIGLGIAEGRDAAELVEEAGEANVIAFHG